MLNSLYFINHFILLPISFGLLAISKNRKILIFSFLIISLHSFINLFIYLNADIEKNFDPILTNFILGLLFILISFRVSDKIESFNYLRKVIIFSFGIYFLIEHLPILRGVVTLIVAFVTVLINRFLGFNCYIAGIDYAGYNIFIQTKLNIIAGNILEVNVPIGNTDINIVLGCSGVREILILGFLIKFTSANFDIKRKTFFTDFLIIFIANILRNVIVVYYTGYKNVSFETTHHIAGSILIFLALFSVTVFTLFKIPEINSHLENILGLKRI